MLQKTILRAVGVVTVLIVATYIQILDHDWQTFGRNAVALRLNERYDTNDPDAVLDVYYPSEVENTERTLPTVVWVHGGSFISGSKDQIANYLRALAAKNYTVVGVNYSLAPAKIYPTPILQVNAALAFLSKNGAGLHVDASKFFLAGDSAGAQIAGQLANVLSNSFYAKQMGVTPSIDRWQLRGVILHCGVFYVVSKGPEIRSYLGKDFMNESRLEEFSVVRNITVDFPPIFISVGNADPLESQSRLLADTATNLGISVDTLFFPSSHRPPLPHEYQFNLDSEAGQLALERTVRFLAGQSQ